MKHKSEKCEYCGTDLQAKTTRKRFCSSKCRVYANREATLVITKAPPANIEKQKLISPAQSTPLELKGIDLAIWRAEQKNKQSL